MELFQFTRTGDLIGVIRLIEQRFVDVNTPNRWDQTALYIACEHGHTRVARYLLENGARVSHYGRMYKPLIAAVRYNHYGCVMLLLLKHADANCRNSRAETPVSVALQSHQDVKLILLLLRYDAIPSASLGDDIAVQLLKNAQEQHAKAIEKLIDGSFINLTVESRPTFLEAVDFAFKRGSVQLAKRMLSNDSFSRIEHRYQKAAVYYSAKKNWPDVLSNLIGKGVNINARTEGQTALCAACEQENKDVVSLLLGNGADPNMANELAGDTALSRTSRADPQSTSGLPLFIAVDTSNSEIVTSLLNAGADANALNARGENVVCFAVETLFLSSCSSLVALEIRKQRLSIVRLLIEHGATFDKQLPYGYSPVYLALAVWKVRYERHVVVELVQLMVEHGAMLKDSSWLPPYHSYGPNRSTLH